MRMTRMVVPAMALLLVELLASAANAATTWMLTPGQVCTRDADGGTGGTLAFDAGGARNDSTVSSLQVVCPVPLRAGVNRELYIDGYDNNSSTDFSCTAFGLDINYSPVSMPSISITGGIVSPTFGYMVVPDSAVSLVIRCQIPAAQTYKSSIGDFYLQW